MQAAPSPDDLPILASFRRAGAQVDCYRLWEDGPVLRIDARGTWDIAAAESYVADIMRIVADLRCRRPQLRAIVDRSDEPVFEAGVAERLMAAYAQILRSGDRVAMIVKSSLVKVRIRQISDREETQTFLSTSAARTWLLAYG